MSDIKCFKNKFGHRAIISKYGRVKITVIWIADNVENKMYTRSFLQKLNEGKFVRLSNINWYLYA